MLRPNGSPDLTEVNRVYALNLERYRKHNKAVHAQHVFWGIITLPTILGPCYFWEPGWNCENHLPPKTNGNVIFEFSY